LEGKTRGETTVLRGAALIVLIIIPSVEILLMTEVGTGTTIEKETGKEMAMILATELEAKGIEITTVDIQSEIGTELEREIMIAPGKMTSEGGTGDIRRED
jgi:hypothetical protein